MECNSFQLQPQTACHASLAPTRNQRFHRIHRDLFRPLRVRSAYLIQNYHKHIAMLSAAESLIETGNKFLGTIATRNALDESCCCALLAHTRLRMNSTNVKTALTVAFASHPAFTHRVLSTWSLHVKLAIAHFWFAVYGHGPRGAATWDKPFLLVTTKDVHAAEGSSLGLGSWRQKLHLSQFRNMQ